MKLAGKKENIGLHRKDETYMNSRTDLAIEQTEELEGRLPQGGADGTAPDSGRYGKPGLY